MVGKDGLVVLLELMAELVDVVIEFVVLELGVMYL